MQTLRSKSNDYPTWLTIESARELQPPEISTLLEQSAETNLDALELIDMRYRQTLAIQDLEGLFASGQLDRDDNSAKRI